MKSHEFTQALSDFNSSLIEVISGHRAKNDFIVIYPIDELEDGDAPDDYIEMRCSSGKAIDVHLLHITQDGFYVVEANDIEEFHTLGLNDFVGVQDRIKILELIEGTLI